MSPDAVSVVVRGLGFVLLFQAAGAVLFAALFGHQLAHSASAIHSLARRAAAAGIAAIVVHLLLDAARMSGAFAGVLDPSMQQMAWTSSSAAAHALQVFGLLLIAISGRAAFMMTLGAAIAVTAFLLTGHTSVHPWRVVLAPLLAIHLLIVAFWFGSLLPLWIASRRDPRDRAVVVLREFSALATWLVPVIAVVGLALTLILAAGVPPLAEPYGALILAKIGGFTLLMLFAAWNKWRLVPAIDANAAQSFTTLQRLMLAEAALIVAVLAVTAVMTTFFSPTE